MDPTLLVHAVRSVLVGNRGWPPTRIEAHVRIGAHIAGGANAQCLLIDVISSRRGSPLGHARWTQPRGCQASPSAMEARPCCARPSHRDRAQLMPALLEAIMNANHANLTPNGRRESKKRALGPARNSSRSGFRTSSITSCPAPTSTRRASLPSWKSLT
jgi:hypothetical protein